ncbi:MAG: aromatic amino acid lyase [Alphaproteobacteria bacterium]|nr:aromatic amino acid lyase [Alphaproteobacteria bacterium]
MTVTIDTRQDLTLHNCFKVAWQGQPVCIGDTAAKCITEARTRFMKLIDDPDVVIYGVTTGYGQNAKNQLTREERTAHAERPPKPAAASWGDPVPDRVARAIVFARLANFVEGHAAISPHIAQAVADMLAGGAMPSVPARGQGGAGEILSLSHLFLELASSHKLGEKDSLSLVNGSPSAAGLVADCALAARKRLELSAKIIALAIESFNAPLSHYDRALEEIWNNPHDAWGLNYLREMIGEGHGGARRPYQAPVSFRIAPRVLGQAQMAVVQAETVAGQSLAAASDNPVILPPDAEHPLGEAISTGGYHNAQSPAAMDQVTAAYANIAILAERMSAKLLDGAVSLLPPQLDTGDGSLPYLGCLSMAATGYEEELRMLTQATLLPGSESGGFGQNDVASPVFLAWSKQERAGALLEATLAALAPIALRALEITDRPVPPKLGSLAEMIRDAFPGHDPELVPGPASGKLADDLRALVYAS